MANKSLNFDYQPKTNNRPIIDKSSIHLNQSDRNFMLAILI